MRLPPILIVASSIETTLRQVHEKISDKKALRYKRFRHNCPRGLRPDPIRDLWSYSGTRPLKDTRGKAPRALPLHALGLPYWVGACAHDGTVGRYRTMLQLDQRRVLGNASLPTGDTNRARIRPLARFALHFPKTGQNIVWLFRSPFRNPLVRGKSGKGSSNKMRVGRHEALQVRAAFAFDIFRNKFPTVSFACMYAQQAYTYIR